MSNNYFGRDDDDTSVRSWDSDMGVNESKIYTGPNALDTAVKDNFGKPDFFGSSATKAGVNFLDNYLKNLDKQRRTDPRTGEEKEKSPLAMAASSSQLASGLSEQRDPFYMMKTGGKFIPGSKGIGERLAGAAVGFAKGAASGQPHMAGIGAVGGFLS